MKKTESQATANPHAGALSALQLVQLNSLPSLVQGEIEQMILRGELAVEPARQ